MKAADVREMTESQLEDKLLELKKEQFNLRFQKASGQLEKTDRINKVRKEISRIKTIMTEKAAS